MTVHAEGAQGLLFPRLVQELGERIGRRARFGRGETLFSAGDKVGGLHLVVGGRVRIVRASSGRSIVVHHEKAGGVLGEVALFGAGVYPATGVASEPTETLLLPAQPLRRAIANDAALADFFLGRLARRAQEIIARLDRLAHHTVLRRVAAH
ncbi:MAG: Crp/Fnr family transcriptional regulator, partial [Gemmatimonadaceae bacterium]